MPTRIVVNPEYPEMVSIAETLLRGGVPAEAVTVYRGRNHIASLDSAAGLLSIKAFRKPGAVNRYAYGTLRKSKAERSYLNAIRLRELGFNTPEPLAFAERRCGGALKESYYICRHLADAVEIRQAWQRPDAPELFKALAHEMARLHRAGVWMLDFSGGNILVTGDAASGYTFHHVDLNRIRFGEHRPDRLMRMFATVMWRPEDIAAIARHYGEEMGLNPSETAFRAVRAYVNFYNSYNRRHRLGRILKPWKK